jgi:hypothetical protein
MGDLDRGVEVGAIERLESAAQRGDDFLISVRRGPRSISRRVRAVWSKVSEAVGFAASRLGGGTEASGARER